MIIEEYAKILRQAELEYEDNKKFIMVLKKVNRITSYNVCYTKLLRSISPFFTTDLIVSG